MSDILLPSGGYQQLLSYKKSVIVFDGTVYFTGKWLSRSDRTIDQMVQAARSCKQNIVEGSMAALISKETELKLTGVAHASLKELEEDYADFMRTRKIGIWAFGAPYQKRFAELNSHPEATYETFRAGIESAKPEISANILLALCKVTGFLLNKQLRSLEKQFLACGGIRERMHTARQEHRSKMQQPPKE